jgi:2-polyprenyl-3-methyl-5-hydroxy-6-metoxy-1,4-benzoquinol methylase
MSSVASHYETHLAPIYVWMAGGMEHALKLGASDVAEFLDTRGYAVDLGAGFGMHTVPLAKSGYRVLAVDTSEYLLAELQRQCSGLKVDVAAVGLLEFPAYMPDRADLILCMGDTLTHLQTEDQAGTSLRTSATIGACQAKPIASFRSAATRTEFIPAF